MSASAQRFAALLESGHAREAGEWALSIEPLLSEVDAREILRLMASELMRPEPRPRPPGDKFRGDRLLPPSPIDPERRVSAEEWERQVYAAVACRTPALMSQKSAFAEVGEKFRTGPDNVEKIFRRLRNRMPTQPPT